MVSLEISPRKTCNFLPMCHIGNYTLFRGNTKKTHCKLKEDVLAPMRKGKRTHGPAIFATKVPKYFTLCCKMRSPTRLQGMSNVKSIKIWKSYLATTNIYCQINVSETASADFTDNIVSISYYYVFSGYQQASEGSHFAFLLASRRLVTNSSLMSHRTE